MIKRACFVGLLCLATVSLVLGFRPPPPIDLAKHVEMSSHIFIGTAKDLVVVDGAGKLVKPEPSALTNFGSAEMNVLVAESLAPDGWKTNGTVKVRFGGAAFTVAALRQQFLGKKLIYLTILQDGYLLPSYPWHLTEPLEARTGIETAIKTNQPVSTEPPESTNQPASTN